LLRDLRTPLIFQLQSLRRSQIPSAQRSASPDGGRRVDSRARGERATVDDEQVRDVVRAVPLVDDGSLGICSHPRRPHVVGEVDPAGVEDGARADGFEHLAGGVRAVPEDRLRVLRRTVADARRRDVLGSMPRRRKEAVVPTPQLDFEPRLLGRELRRAMPVALFDTHDPGATARKAPRQRRTCRPGADHHDVDAIRLHQSVSR
jgi:hypothetical protein